MTSAEEQRALAYLAQLLKKDLSQVDRAELIRGIKRAELIFTAAPLWSGRLLAVLYRTGLSWPEVAQLTGLSRSTAWRRAEPYL